MRATRSNPDTVAAPMGTYSQAVRVETGDAVWIHVSGQIAIDREGNLVGPGDLRAQTRQVFENLKAILEANGATFADAVKIGTYLTTLDDLAGMREVRSEYLHHRTPREHGRAGRGARRPRRADRDRPRRGGAGVTAVAVLGLGAMGRAIATRLLGAGHDVTVWNRTPGRDEELVAAGARRAGTPADAVRDAEVVITMVTDGRALEEVLFGSDGAASAISPEATLIDMSTVGPTSIASVAERLAPVPLLDAPVLGSVPSVAERHARGLRRRGPRGVRPARRSALAARHAEVPGRVWLGRDVEARQQRGRHRGPRGRRGAPRADRPCGDRSRRRPRQPGRGSARLADRTLASAPDGRGPRLLLPSGLGAQGPRTRVGRGRTERHRTHRRPSSRGPGRRSDRGWARRRGLRRDRPVPAGGRPRAQAVRLPSSA